MKYEQKTGGHAGTPGKGGKPYLSHVPDSALSTKYNGMHRDHPTNNMSLNRLGAGDGSAGPEDGEME